MKNKSVLILVSSLILGLGWAIRGAFGHEWGAAWAGGLVGIALVGLSKREDWLRRAPILTLLAAIGWGIGGMMSYGIVVGYCKGNDFFNVYYGYAMLAVIGGLYGFFGGGLFALGLETTDKRPIDCARLITEMCVGGFLFWGFFIFQLEWFMTPPRSELWAGCAGAAMALTWFMKREGYHKSFRVALFSALGAGVGFSFGNFIQVIGIKAGIHYNLWNVMEFTLGALGGFGMAYAIFTTNWPSSPKPSKKANWGALMIILMILPFINYIEAFNKTKLINTATKHFKYSSPEFIANQQFIHATFIFLLFTLGGIVLWTKYNKTAKLSTSNFIPLSMFGFALYYTLFGIVKSAIYLSPLDFSYSTYTYLPVLIITYLIWHFKINKCKIEYGSTHISESIFYWLKVVMFLIVGISIMTLLSLNIFDVQLDAHQRF